MGSVSALSIRRNRQYMSLALVWIILVLAGLGYYVSQSYHATYKLVADSSENEAEVLSRSMASTLRRATTILDWVAENSESIPRDRLPRYLRAQGRSFPEVHGFVVYDGNGTPLVSTVRGEQVCTVDVERYLRNTVGEYTFTNSVDCPETGSRIMLVQRELQDSAGKAVGLVAAVINLSYYENLFSTIDVGINGMVSIRRSDTSHLVVRWPFEAHRMNNAAPEIPPQKRIESHSTRGVVRYIGATDGVERIFAYNQVEGFPFYVLVGRAYREQFASWRLISAGTAAVALLMVVLTALLLRRLNRETEDLIAADTVIRKVLADNDILIQELLHRTNNYLQVVASLIQLERLNSGDSPDRPALNRLDVRIRALALVQKMLRQENNYTSIPLCAYLEALRNELCNELEVHPEGTCEIVCPAELQLILDAAAPVGLIVSELLLASCDPDGQTRSSSNSGGSGRPDALNLSLVVSTDTTESIQFIYTDARAITPGGITVQLITALANHQLKGTVTFQTTDHFRCRLSFTPNLYRPRVPE